MGISDKNNLGQYFTPENIAKFMANEITSSPIKPRQILDPCIGKNIFFSFLDSDSTILHGVEIDQNLINHNTEAFFNKSDRNLILGDFIDQEFDNKFDAVIMNPPYTRQEMISVDLKQRLKSIKEEVGIELSAKANLYVYFLLKSLLLLKDKGLLVAITYDSWLYSSFGANLKEYLTYAHNLKEIIHFKNHAFDGVDVGATIIIIEKGSSTSTIKYSEYESANTFSSSSLAQESKDLNSEDLLNFNDYTFSNSKINLQSSIFVPLDNISEKLPWRGTSSPANKYFLFQSHNEDFTPILKKTPQDTYSMTEKDAVYAFSVNPENNLSDNHARLEQIKQTLLECGSEALKQKIAKDPYWFKFPIKPGGEILFNYYFRDNIRFILNKENIATMGNYYNISCPVAIYETFAILNSSLTRYALLRNSKNQGNGLKKIQLYKFNKIPILPLEKFTSEELEMLKKLGNLLANNENVINDINDLVINRYCQLLNLDFDNTRLLIERGQS